MEGFGSPKTTSSASLRSFHDWKEGSVLHGEIRVKKKAATWGAKFGHAQRRHPPRAGDERLILKRNDTLNLRLSPCAREPTVILSPITCCNRTDQTNIYQPTSSRTKHRMPRSCELVTNNIHGHQHSTLAISTRAVTAFLPAWKGFGAVSPASAAPQVAFFGPGTQALAVTNATPSPSFWLAGWRVP